MPLPAILMVFAVSWWVLLFTLLPVDIESDSENRFGSGAPKTTGLLKKMLATTLLAAIATGIIYLIISKNLFSL